MSRDYLELITPNMLLIGRNNARSPTGFVHLEFNPVKALDSITDLNEKLLDLLGDFVHRFIPGKKIAEGDHPVVNDIVLFTAKEAQRARNVKYKYGRVVEVNVDGRLNKIRIKYKNADEVFRKIREKMYINLFNTKDKGMNKVS